MGRLDVSVVVWKIHGPEIRMKIILFVNSLKTFYWHRQSLAEKLISEGHDVLIVTSKDEKIKDTKVKFQFEFIDLNRKSLNPFKELFSLLSFFKILIKFRPHILHNFTVKCVIYGSFSSIFVPSTRVVNSITGLGSAFIRESTLSKFIRFLYRSVFHWSKSQVIFQNEDDFDYFQNYKLISKKHAHLIPGSGVDLSKFTFSSMQPDDSKIKILFASRLLRDKGIVELVEAVALLNKKNLQFQCIIAGDIDAGNPTSLTTEEFTQSIQDLPISWLGYISDIVPVMKDCQIVCLPSYREGLPMILLEAAAMGKGIVATDVPGCRGVVLHGATGLLANVKDSESLANELEKMITNGSLRTELGAEARKYVEKKFEKNLILSQILRVYCLE